jgi:predicted nucleic acid-binding protein
MAAPEPSRLGMLQRVVIADAGPLIGLARIGCLNQLRALFGGVTLPAVVAAEIGIDPRDVAAMGGASSDCAGLDRAVISSETDGWSDPDVRIHPRPGASAIAEALGAGWLRIASPSGLPDIEPLIPGVDPGERSTIALALHWQAAGAQVLVIVDDCCGRAEARSRGLSILGTAAVLVLAKEQRLIPACAPLLVALREEGYYLSDGLVAAVLAEVGEA